MLNSVTPWAAAHQASLSFSVSQSLITLVSIESVMPSYHLTISSSVVSFSSCLQSFPASGSFPMSWLFMSGGQSFGASTSASVLPMNIQGWFLLGLTGLISFLSKGLSRVFSSTTVRRHQFFSTQPFLLSSSWQPHGLQHTRLPCPSPTPGASSNSCPLSWWCHPTISSLSPSSPPALNLSQHQGHFQWLGSWHQVPKVLELQHQSFQWIFRVDFL